MNKRFYLTTAIDYVNGAPHLGHAYEKVLADVIARARRSMGAEVFFLTGLDEHGQKVQQAAQEQGKTPQAYCDELAVQWRAFVQRLGLSNDDFIRTTDTRHKEVVQAILAKLHAENQFYKKPYVGFYSVREETFLTEKDRNPDGTWDAKWGQVNELVEENWYFKLGEHQAWLIGYLEANPGFIQPDYRRNEVLGFLRSQTLEDLCITRPAARLSWGIPLPFDPAFVTYVWFDALVNYFSVPASLGDPVALEALGQFRVQGSGSEVSGPDTEASGNSSLATRHSSLPDSSLVTRHSSLAPLSLWPADIHLIGKDILKFHAVYWPIMLKALGAPLPKTLLVHGWWQKDGAKLSKSTGNVVDPIAVIDEWGLDAFRYYLVRELGIGPDGNWTDDGFKSRYNAELANGLGNLLNRSISMLNKYRGGLVPTRSDELKPEAVVALKAIEAKLVDYDLQGALVEIWKEVNRANLYIEQTRPFSLAKDPAQAARLDEVLYNLVEICRILAVLLWPFIPATAEKIFAQLNVAGSPADWKLTEWGGLTAGHQIGAPIPLFPRKDLAPK
ncbi:MAG TPA: class I tRNA ligase family protein [Candidatus Limnocylindria bacterium]|jgi:methionyl-tRNA synthetase|nr:class I tRNA ligase family protein [Candidatus Limnocylindria bacterium]